MEEDSWEVDNLCASLSRVSHDAAPYDPARIHAEEAVRTLVDSAERARQAVVAMAGQHDRRKAEEEERRRYERKYKEEAAAREAALRAELEKVDAELGRLRSIWALAVEEKAARESALRSQQGELRACREALVLLAANAPSSTNAPSSAPPSDALSGSPDVWRRDADDVELILGHVLHDATGSALERLAEALLVAQVRRTYPSLAPRAAPHQPTAPTVPTVPPATHARNPRPQPAAHNPQPTPPHARSPRPRTPPPSLPTWASHL